MRPLRGILPLLLVVPVAAPLAAESPDQAAEVEGRVHPMQATPADPADPPVSVPDAPPVDPIGLVVSHLVHPPPKEDPPAPDVSYGPWYGPEAALERTGSHPPADAEEGTGRDDPPAPVDPPAAPADPAPAEPPATGSPAPPPAAPAPSPPTPEPSPPAPAPPRRCFLLCLDLPLLGRSS